MESEFDRALQAAKDAHDREDWPAAIAHWKDCIKLNPGFFQSYWIGGSLLLQFGDVEEAEALLSRGVALNPTHVSMAVSHAKAATLLRDWPEAVRRWNALSNLAPDDKEVIQGRAEAEVQIHVHRLNKSGGALDEDWKRFEAGRIVSADTDLFMQFQSLGDNCEFGLVQRHFLAEPVSLLRWSSISLGALTDAITDGFRDIGNPANTKLEVGAGDEYVLYDLRYNIAMHTFIQTQYVKDEPDDLYKKMCSRQNYLGRQMRDDLEESDQIFVYRCYNGATVEEIKSLHSAMNVHGENKLLFALEADEQRPAGSVEEIAPRLYIGSIGHFAEPWRRLD